MNSTPPELVAIARVIGESRELQAWFRNLMSLPQNLRASAIGRLAAGMREAGEDAKTVSAFEMLSAPDICAAVDRVIRTRYPSAR